MTIQEIYSELLERAELHRRKAESGKGDHWDEGELANELYHWAAKMEQTEEINPRKE